MRKTYSLNVEDGKVVSVEVNGVLYQDSDEIDDPNDRLWMSFLVSSSPEMTPLTPTVAPFPLERYLFLIFLMVAVVMLSVATLTGVSAYRSLGRERSAEGRVTDLVTRKNSDGNEFFYPTVEFSLPDGRLKNAQIPEGSWPAAYEQGDKVTILYNVEKPSQARIASASSSLGLWIWTIISGILGLAFLGATLLAASLMRSSASTDQTTFT